MGLRLVVLGMMGAYPFGGQTWLYLNWLSSLARAGHEVWYVEDNGFWPFDPRVGDFTDSPEYAVKHVASSVARVGLADRWIYRWTGPPERCWGARPEQLRELLRSCDALLNVCTATIIREHHMLAPLRVWVETDPVIAELSIAIGNEGTRRQMLELHDLYATYGENYGAPDCGVPLPDVRFAKTRQPVDLELWPAAPASSNGSAGHFTTVANYRMASKEVGSFDIPYEGEVYTWSKHTEWARFMTLPSITEQTFELALKAEAEEMALFRENGWGVVPALPMTLDIDRYQRFIQDSRGQFTVAKDQNIRLRSGWFSERDACYLASGRPVVAQDTAFVIPTGDGLFAVGSVEEAAAAIAEINGDYARHSAAARRLAEEHFEGHAVVTRLLSELGLT
jgi:hypothetical protein